MRVIAGKYKRTPIKTLDGKDVTRPTKDMVKEALFSSIDIKDNTCFLDLFSGSGSIGIEALSRGANEVIFNDINKEAVKIIKENLEKVREKRTIYNLDYEKCLAAVSNTKFDYIFCDPPYDFLSYEKLFFIFNEYESLNKKGIIIIEVRKNTDLLETYYDFEKYKEKKYGISKLIYYRRNNND